MLNNIEDTGKIGFSKRYTPMGVIIPVPLVNEVLENKHGIDNRVVDLNINQSTVTSGTTAPVSTPTELGLIYIKTNTAKVYISTGIASASDWTLVN